MKKALTRLYFTLIGIFLAAPIVVVAGVSVNAKQSLNFPPQGFSLAWYGAIFTDTGWRSAFFSCKAARATLMSARVIDLMSRGPNCSTQ